MLLCSIDLGIGNVGTLKILCKVNKENTTFFLPLKTLFPQKKWQVLYECTYGHFGGNLW